MESSLAHTKVALLHNGHHHHARIVQLARRLAGDSVVIDVSAERLAPGQLEGYDLILMEAFELTGHFQKSAVNNVRADTRAPLVMLTNTRRPDNTIEALQFGADAVIPLQSHNDVILAHCRALLRRWHTPNTAAS